MIGMQQNVKRLNMSIQKMKSTIFLTENKKSLPNHSSKRNDEAKE